MSRNFRVAVKILRELSATTWVRARNQAEADKKAIAAYYRDAHTDEGQFAGELGLPRKRWDEHESNDFECEIDHTFRCVDCGKDTCGGEYYMISNALWAAAGVEPHGGMLCLADLERRIGRWLTIADFTALVPSAECWHRHLAARTGGDAVPAAVQLELLEDALGPPSTA